MGIWAVFIKYTIVFAALRPKTTKKVSLLERSRGTNMKNRLVMIVLGVLVILAAGAMFYAIYSNQSVKEEFAEDGYIIVFNDKDPAQPAKTYHFTEGTTFKRTYEGSIQFRDTEGNTVTADSNSFVHYDSGNSASLSKSVLVNLDEVESSAQNYYGLSSGTTVSRSGSTYIIDNADNSVDLSEYLWKVGDNRYMMVSDNINVTFSDGTSRDYEDYIELLYQEGGMVCIMHGDEVIRDASRNTYVTVDNGVSINLNTQMIVTDNSEGTGKDVLMSLGQITTDSDQVVNVLPADEDKLKIVIPEFIFNVTDGKNGEAGADGENGINGANGDSGADGVSGESGRTGIIGYDGDNGEPGQAGTSGRSGSNGTEGAMGTDGAQGAAGPGGAQGSSGGAGGAGAPGAAGPSGPSGSDGDQGNPGAPGANGESVQLKNPSDVLKEVPVLFWSDAPVANYSEITGTFGFKTSIDDKAAMSVRNIKVTLIDLSSGKVVHVQNVSDEMTTGINSDKTELSGFDHLIPGNAYTLTVEGQYDYKGQKVDTSFFTTTLVTDDFPLSVNVYNVEKDKIDIELINRDAGADTTTQFVTRTFSVGYALVDALGNTVTSTSNYTLSNNINAASNPTVIHGDGTTSDHLYIDAYDNGGTRLSSNTMYYFSITSLDSNSANIPSRYVKIPIRTLKATPTIANVVVLPNIVNQSFDLSVTDVFDPDHAITRYRYEIRDTLNNLKKVIYAPNNDVVHCYVDGQDLNVDEYYTVRAIAEAFDNRKNIEATCDFPDQVTLNGVTQYTWFTLDNKAACLTPNSIGTTESGGAPAHFSLHIPARATLKENSPVRIVYHSNAVESGSIKVGWTQDWTQIYNAQVTDYTKEKIYPMDQTIGNLRASTTYKIDAYGTVDLTGENIYTDMCLGSVIVTTPAYKPVSGNPGGPTQGGSSNIHPIYFTLSLDGTDVGEGPNKPSYAVKQAGSTFTDPDTQESFQGSVRVQLLTNVVGSDPEEYELVCEGDIKLKMSGTKAVPDTNDQHITLEDFPGNPKITSFADKYKVHIVEAYDSTSYKNVIKIENTVDYETTIGKTYPDPGSLSLDVVPITKENYNLKTNKGLPVEYKDYDPTTVIGFELRPVGLERTVSYFDYIEFYAYDADYFSKHMAGKISTLKSSNPPEGTTFSKVSCGDVTNGSEENGVDYFYPLSDKNYMAKFKLKLKDTANGTPMSGTVNGIFLFEDFNGTKGTCEAKVKATNESIHSGFEVEAKVNDGSMEPENNATQTLFFRGRDYEFTFRLISSQATMGETKYYPEVLGDDKACVLKCPFTVEAPYEKPTYYFYPYTSDASTLIYGYYIKTVDATQIFAGKGFVTSNGNASSQVKGSGTWVNQIDVNQDALIKIDSLSRNMHVVVTLQENLYLTKYQRETTVTTFTRLFTSNNIAPQGVFTVTPQDTLSRVNFKFVFDNAEMAKSVAAIVGSFSKGSGTPKPVTLKILNVNGTDIEAYAQYSDLTSIAKNGEEVTVTFTVYYDTGNEGFGYAFPANPDSTDPYGLVAVREAGENNEGQYLVQQGVGGGDFLNKNLTQTELRAQDSIFKITKNPSAVGAQNQDIAGTRAGEYANPGLIALQLRNWENGEWYYDTSSSARAGLNGARDSRITKSSVPFTVSVIANSTSLKLKDTNEASATFKLGAVIPFVNLHQPGSTAFTIYPGQNDARVNFVITGVKGAVDSQGEGLYGYNGTTEFGKIYTLLYQVVNGAYVPIMEDGRQKRFETVLTHNTPGAEGDGEYTVNIDNLEANSHYAVQLVYYKTPEDYQADTGTETWTKRVYPKDALNPLNETVALYYQIYTTQTIQLAQDMTSVMYKANGYNDKRLEIKYALSSASPKLKPDEYFIYALYLGDELVLTHKELAEGRYLEQGHGNMATLYVNPGQTIVGHKSNEDVALNFNGKGTDGDVRNYRLRIIPMSDSAVKSYSQAADTAPSELYHSETFRNSYNSWLSAYSLGVDHNNPSLATFVSFGNLKDLASPFYNIRAYSEKNKIKFRISVVDADGVIYNNQYMVRAYKKNGTELTAYALANYDNAILSSTNSQTVMIDNLADNEEITLKVYAVEDYRNIEPTYGISSYTATFGNTTNSGNTEQECINAKKYNMRSATERSTGESGFSAGSIEAVRQTLPNSAYLDFVNPSNIRLMTSMHIDISYPTGNTTSLTDFSNPFTDNSSCSEPPVTVGEDTTYRFTGIPGGEFYEAGNYIIAIRMTITYYDGNSSYKTETIDKLINFTVA